MGKPIEPLEPVIKIEKSNLTKPVVVRTIGSVRSEGLRRAGLLVRSEQQVESVRVMVDKEKTN